MTDNPSENELIRQVARLRAAQARMEGEELERLVRAYAGIYDATQRKVDLLLEAIAKNEGQISKGQLQRMARYKQLMREVESELSQYETFVRVELRAAGNTAIAVGERDARQLASIAFNDMYGARPTMRAINPTVIEELVGFLDPSGPLYKRLAMLPSWTADQVAEAILNGIGLGRNPRAIAREITRTMGMGLTESLRMMRTVQLYAYREANRASYLANSDIVRGWIWYAELDGMTCASCIAMHGTRHTNNERLNDHHNGRCTMIPDVIGAKSVVAQTGDEWFKGLSEEQQKSILGQSKWQAWQDGKFTLADVVGTQLDEVYGEMRAERSLKDLLGQP